MEKFSTEEKITQLLMLETSLLNYRMSEFAHLVNAENKGKVYLELSHALEQQKLSKSQDITAYLNKNHAGLADELKEQAASVLNLMSRAGENVYHTVSLLKFNYEVDRYNEPTACVTAGERKALEEKYEEEKAFFARVAKKTDRLGEILEHPFKATEDEKLLLAMMDGKIQKIIEDVYLQLEGKASNKAKFVALEDVIKDFE
ncbi:MAG: hypothetical protein J6V53_03420 [Alphaproteobacteria bacterium]|nr:hypothetical protein [Alphaproteobacteria bacterium]